MVRKIAGGFLYALEPDELHEEEKRKIKTIIPRADFSLLMAGRREREHSYCEFEP